MVKSKKQEEKCIILNKPVIGGYIDRSNENEAHELINFFLDDKGNHFIYCNPYGQNVADAASRKVEYVLFTSPSKNGCFYIEYIIKVKAILHTQSLPKPTDGNQPSIESKVKDAKKEIETKLAEYGYNSISDIKYGGISIDKLFTDSIKVIPVTFLAETIVKVKTPIQVKKTIDEKIFDYNFQRNFGYVTSKTKNPIAYNKLHEIIEEELEKGEQLKLGKFISGGTVAVVKPTFMDLISMFRQEECYTQILYKLLNYKKELINSFLHDLDSSIEIDTNNCDNWEVDSEYYIEKVGRLDLYIRNNRYNIIIENKIDSGINFVTKEGKRIDQLERYYQYFEKQESTPEKENRYIILVPNEKIGLLKEEIEHLDIDECVKEAYRRIEYKKIYKFFNCHKNEYSGFEYKDKFDDIIELFRRLSLTRKDICEENLLQNIAKLNNNP